jgi:hypothetical protein
VETRLTAEDVEDMLLLRLQHGVWCNSKQLRAACPGAGSDLFWGRLSALYKAKIIEREFDPYGDAIYRRTDLDT